MLQNRDAMAAIQVVSNNSVVMRLQAEAAAEADSQQHAQQPSPSDDPPAAVEEARTPEADKLQRDISKRHMIFIALGGSIGAGLFIGSGGALSAGGPLSLVLNFAIVGLGVTCTMSSLGEMAAAIPVAGSFYTHATMFISEAWGFALGWNFVLNWVIVFPFELACIVSQLRFWVPDVHPAVVITPILVGLIMLSFLGSRWYGEVERAFGFGKALAILVFMVMAVLVSAGGVPDDPRGGTHVSFWQRDLVLRNGFSGFMFVFRTAGMSYGGTELLGMTAAECRDPTRLLPMATWITFFRIAIFYVVALALLTLVVSADDPELSVSGHGAKVSPFTLAAQRANIRGLANFFNAFIIVALLSMANASIYASSRAVQALCDKGMGPRLGARVKRGVPVYAFAVAFVFGLLAYIEMAPGGEAIFDWLLSLSGSCNYYTWISICVSHICFRRGWKAQGHAVGELLWRSPFGVAGSWIGLVICVMGLLANVFTAILPIGGKYDAGAVVRDNIGTLIPPAVYVGYLVWKRLRVSGPVAPVFRPPAELDLSAVRLVQEPKSLAAAEKRIGGGRLHAGWRSMFAPA